MRALASLFVCVVVATFASGCASPWPTDLPPARYTGNVVNAALRDRPEPGATVTAIRPALHGVTYALVAEETLGNTTSDLQGRFVLQTRSGTAARLEVTSADGRRGGSVYTDFRSPTNLTIRLVPRLYSAEYKPAANPSSTRVRGADAAIRQLIVYLSAHPEEPCRSLRAYAAAGVISAKQFGFLTEEPSFFLGWTPEVKYFWGRGQFVFLSADAPIKF